MAPPLTTARPSAPSSDPPHARPLTPSLADDLSARLRTARGRLVSYGVVLFAPAGRL